MEKKMKEINPTGQFRLTPIAFFVKVICQQIGREYNLKKANEQQE